MTNRFPTQRASNSESISLPWNHHIHAIPELPCIIYNGWCEWSLHVLWVMDGQVDLWMDGWIDWKVDRWMDLWMDMRMDGWVTSRLKTKLTMAGLYHGFQRISSLIGLTRDHFEHAPSQLETRLHCNVISHWLGAYTKWSLFNRKLNEQNQVLFHRRCCTKCKNWMKRKYGVHSCTFLNHFMLVDSFICRQTLSWYLFLCCNLIFTRVFHKRCMFTFAIKNEYMIRKYRRF